MASSVLTKHFRSPPTFLLTFVSWTKVVYSYSLCFNDLPYDPDFEFPEKKLILGEVLGSGAFGKVIKAEAIGINNLSPRDKSQKKGRLRPKMFRQHRAGHAYALPLGSWYAWPALC